MQGSLRWLLLDLNSYFASVEQQLNPKLRGKPVAVVPSLADTTSCIAASYEAKAFGVKTGTSVRDAKKMCPGITLISGNHNHYIEYHHRIIDAVESVLPVKAVLSIDEMACELIGKEREYENARLIALKMKQTVYEKVGSALSCSIGIAPNRFLAKVASDMQKPNGLTFIYPDKIFDSLKTLKLRDMPGIGHNMEARLHRFNIRSMDQLLQLSKHEMRAIWGGINGEIFYQILRGENLPEKETQRGSFSHSHVLPPDLRNEAGSYAVAQKLVHKLSARLRKNEYWGQDLYLSIRYVDGTKWSERQGFLEAQDNFTLLRALQSLWSKKPKTKTKPLKIGVWISDLTEEENHNISFFEDKKLQELSKSLDIINDKYGKDSIYFAGTELAKKATPVRIAFTNIPERDDV